MCIVFSTRWQITGRARRAGKFVRCGLELERTREAISVMVVGIDGQWEMDTFMIISSARAPSTDRSVDGLYLPIVRP